VKAEAIDRRFEDLREGERCVVEYLLTSEIYLGFLQIFDDRNPMHVDESAARRSGFDGKVMHGGILNGFLSHFVGMHLPGKRSLLLSSEISFLQPCYEGDRLRFEGVIDQKMEAQRVVVLKFSVSRLSRAVAKGRVQVRLADEAI